ncbi:MAG: hypothetical protein ACHP8A_20910, partial [Terriglobales bacterium]
MDALDGPVLSPALTDLDKISGNKKRTHKVCAAKKRRITTKSPPALRDCPWDEIALKALSSDESTC